MSELPVSLNIYQRINEVRKKVDYLKKEKSVEGYKAITHDEVTSELRPHLIEFGIIVEIHEINSELQQTKKSTRTGTPYTAYVARYDVHFVNMDKPKDRSIVSVGAVGEDHGDKGPGKAASYATKTAMLKVFSIETGESDESRQEQKPIPITEEQLIKLREICESYDFPIDKTLKAMAKKLFQLNKIEDLPQELFQQACEAIDNKGKEKNASAK